MRLPKVKLCALKALLYEHMGRTISQRDEQKGVRNKKYVPVFGPVQEI